MKKIEVVIVENRDKTTLGDFIPFPSGENAANAMLAFSIGMALFSIFIAIDVFNKAYYGHRKFESTFEMLAQLDVNRAASGQIFSYKTRTGLFIQHNEYHTGTVLNAKRIPLPLGRTLDSDGRIPMLITGKTDDGLLIEVEDNFHSESADNLDPIQPSK